jgi:hypothetical protein
MNRSKPIFLLAALTATLLFGHATVAGAGVVSFAALVGDFNNDGNADVLWRDGGSAIAIWLMTGPTAPTTGVFGDPGAAWVIRGVGDVDGDKKSDIIWQNTLTGMAYAWFMDGAAIKNQGVLANTPGPDWAIIGIGDFNDDTKADLLWQDTTTPDSIVVWLMDGTTRLSSGFLTRPGADFVVRGNGDFSIPMDGNDDVVWQDTTTGDILVWEMAGVTIGDAGPITNAGPNWVIQLVLDLDGTGGADLLWRNAILGEMSAWLMAGLTEGTTNAIVDPGASWTPLFGSNYSGPSINTIDDVLWQNTNGAGHLWFMNGAAIGSHTSIGNPGMNWAIVNSGG